jgi:hypothetical protein
MSAGRQDTTILFRKTEDKYFSREDWTVESALKRLANFGFSGEQFFTRAAGP